MTIRVNTSQLVGVGLRDLDTDHKDDYSVNHVEGGYADESSRLL